MANEFMQAAKMAYGFSGTTQKILWFLCDEISANTRKKYLKSRVGFVVRSYDLIAFRCACNRWSITQAIKILTEARVLKAIKRGPRKYFLFCIYLDRLIALRREWAVEKREMEIADAFSDLIPAAEDIAEEEAMWAAEAQEEERMELASWSPSRLNSELDPGIGSANVKSAEDVHKSVQRLAQPMSAVEKPMSSAGKPMSNGRKANVKKARRVAESTDSDALPEVTENAYGGSLSGVVSRFAAEQRLFTVPEGPAVASHVQSTQTQNSQTSGTSSPNPRDREIHSPSPQGAKRPSPKIAPPPSPKAKKPEENLCGHGKAGICRECEAQRSARIKEAAEERNRRCKHEEYARNCQRCKQIAAGDLCKAHERFSPCKDCDPTGYEDSQEWRRQDAAKETRHAR